MEGRVVERKQAEHPAVLNDDVPAGEAPQWRDGKRQEQKLEGPSARLQLNSLGRIRAEAHAPQTEEQVGCRKEREAEEERFDESTH